MLVGFIRYLDEPGGKYFRKVYPAYDEELDEPAHYFDARGKKVFYVNENVFSDDYGKPLAWTEMGCNPQRVAVMDKFAAGGKDAAAAEARLTAVA